MINRKRNTVILQAQSEQTFLKEQVVQKNREQHPDWVLTGTVGMLFYYTGVDVTSGGIHAVLRPFKSPKSLTEVQHSELLLIKCPKTPPEVQHSELLVEKMEI